MRAQFAIRIVVIVLWLLKMSRCHSPSLAKPNCQQYCSGDTSLLIPYPFGIGTNCYSDKWFEIECRESKPYIKSLNLELLSIGEKNTIQVLIPTEFRDLKGSPFYFSRTDNIFVGVGCNIVAYLTDQSDEYNAIVWCASVCGSDSFPRPCEASVQENLQALYPKIQAISTNVTLNQTNYSPNTDNSSCAYTLLASQRWFDREFRSWDHKRYCKEMSYLKYVPVNMGVMINYDHVFTNWSSMNGSRNDSSDCYSESLVFPVKNGIVRNESIQCSCRSGYHGNPYLPYGYGCLSSGGEIKKTDWTTIVIGVCSAVGALFLITGGWFFWRVARKVINKRKKHKFFKQNGGLLLQQHVSSSDGNVDITKVFNSYELDKATDHYNANRVLGQGGQGTVYKGMLSDGRIVAVKKSKIADTTNVEQFINEVVILSQINQRNVVKLLGCCLETEVPLLVYEFISNGTLYQHIHNPNEDFPLTWNIRLRIAKEVANALSYLHSAASMPIYHRDIKSTNILLDDKYKARVCDFGTSRSVDIDKTHVTTRVQGTFGYLDPEYFQSSQFTEKSDVYSFGVVLVELLTGHKPIFSDGSREVRGLASYFLEEMEESRFVEMIDPRISNENKIDEIVTVAHLAKQCLHLNGRARPTMKELASCLDRITTSQEQFVIQENYGVFTSHGIDYAEAYDTHLSSTETWGEISTNSSLDVFPLLK